MTDPRIREAANAIECVLLVSGEPVRLDQLVEATQAPPEVFSAAPELRQQEYADRGLEIQAVAGGYQLGTRPAYAEAVRRYLGAAGREPLSQAALETPAIVAYRQPITPPAAPVGPGGAGPRRGGRPGLDRQQAMTYRRTALVLAAIAVAVALVPPVVDAHGAPAGSAPVLGGTAGAGPPGLPGSPPPWGAPPRAGPPAPPPGAGGRSAEPADPRIGQRCGGGAGGGCRGVVGALRRSDEPKGPSDRGPRQHLRRAPRPLLPAAPDDRPRPRPDHAVRPAPSRLRSARPAADLQLDAARPPAARRGEPEQTALAAARRRRREDRVDSRVGAVSGGLGKARGVAGDRRGGGPARRP